MSHFVNEEEIIDQDISTRKKILKLAWPVIIEQSLATITHIVDMMMVGRLGAVAVTAIGLTVQPLLFAQAIGAALSVGTTALVARFIGSGNNKDAGRVLQQSLLSSMVLALIGGIIFFYFAKDIIGLMGAEKQVIEAGTYYLQLVIPGFIFMFISFIITAALRGASDTQTPMKINMFINILNVIGNYILIFGHLGAPALGLRGAAISTSIARFLGAVILIYIIFTEKSVITIVRKNFFKFEPVLLKRIMKIGVPTALEQLVMRVAQIFYVRVVAGLGTLAFAAHQISISAESMSYMPGFGMAVAATTLVGQNLGADQPEKAEESSYEAWKIGSLIMGFMALLFLLIPELLIKLYTDNPEIIRLGARNLRIIAFAQLPMGTQFIFAASLRGAGDTRWVFYSTAISSWIGRFAMAYIFINVFHWGLVGAWLAMAIDWLMRGSMVLYRFWQGKWKKIKI